MKKSMHSILTAAMFAAAVTTSLSDPAVSAQGTVSPAETQLMDDTERGPQSAYGPPSWFTEPTNESSTTEAYTTTPMVLYGPPWVFAEKGDMNYDRVLNARDVTQLKRAILTGVFTNEEDYLADVNDDGTIDKEDVKALIRQLTGKPEDEEENAVTTFITNSTDTTTTTVTALYGPPPAWK